MADTAVLIAGAGPTGLVLALWLTRQGVAVRIIDRAAAAGTTSRALAVQARTLELYRQLDLARAVVEQGHRVPAVNLWARGEKAARVDLMDIGAGLTPYPFLQIYPQDEHERLLSARLLELGVSVERNTELISFTDTGDRVTARLRTVEGKEETAEACYLAGCDGARSRVRESLGSGFAGGTYRHLFYVADIEGSGPPIDGELHVDLDEADFLGVFPLAGAGRARLIGTLQDERTRHPESLRFEDVSQRAIHSLALSVRKVNWFSTYHVHHRVAGHFGAGRVFLLGDAAHIHSPVGGQGMNTGIGDAINLAWKLAAVLGGCARPGLLATYEDERIGFARRLVATTDRVFTLATSPGKLAEVLRTRVAPALLGRALALERVREYLFRTVSQLVVEYRGSALSAGQAGQIHGGDRLPWIAHDGTDNYASLALSAWQVHVYGNAAEPLRQWCAAQGLPLQRFHWSAVHETAGIERDTLCLLRPDSYVALADRNADPATLGRYFSERALRPQPLPGAPAAALT
ncbi:MAG TPA: FAD-dependent monooxygenase [Steroidobacteraceae bacterium]|nr:FAD-dependent monooxygenase [Steroidobacteraceae bacterium]